MSDAWRRRVRRLLPARIRAPIGRSAYRVAAAARRAGRAPGGLASSGLARLPILAARDLVYDDRFFERMDRETEELYVRLAEAIVELWAPKTVLDVGCGSGFVLAKLADRGVAVRGVEGSRAAIRRSPVADRIVRANLEHGVPELGRFELSLCLEVAEHLRPRSSAPLVRGLTRASDVVVFSAAHPGQPGTAHLNLQPKFFWESLFAQQRFVRSPRERDLAEAISRVPRPEYIHENLMVFERAS